MPVFLIFGMQVVKNKKSGISSLYLAQLENAQHKNLAVIVYGHVYIIRS